jgi:hypothetical protein
MKNKENGNLVRISMHLNTYKGDGVYNRFRTLDIVTPLSDCSPHWATRFHVAYFWHFQSSWSTVQIEGRWYCNKSEG